MEKRLRRYTIRNLKPGRFAFIANLSITSWLILINILVFIIGSVLIAIYPQAIDYIALKPANIFAGKSLWTIVTSVFMHGGIVHILANMISLFFLGGLIEKIIGRKRYIWLYVISGIVASLAFVALSLVFTSDYGAYAVGASGAIFALVGLLMILTPNLPVYVMAIIPVRMKYAGVFLLVVLWIISLSTSIGIGNTAHLGGLLAGVVYGLYLRKKYKRKTEMLAKMFG